MTSYGIAVLFAGEIIPQALCKSYALLIGNYCAGMVRVLCYAVGIISWPVSKVLDYVLGNEHTVTCLLLSPGSPLCVGILQQCCTAGLHCLCCRVCLSLPSLLYTSSLHHLYILGSLLILGHLHL